MRAGPGTRSWRSARSRSVRRAASASRRDSLQIQCRCHTPLMRKAADRHNRIGPDHSHTNSITNQNCYKGRPNRERHRDSFKVEQVAQIDEFVWTKLAPTFDYGRAVATQAAA